MTQLLLVRFGAEERMTPDACVGWRRRGSGMMSRVVRGNNGSTAEGELYMGRKQVESAAWPEFDSPVLTEIAAAFLRRRKAIAYKTRASGGLSCTRDFSETEAEVYERLDLDVRGGHLRLCVWADGSLWLSVSVRAAGRNAGWAFQDAFHGDVGDVSAATLVNMIEATLELGLGAEPAAEREQLRALWGRVHPDTA